MRLPGSVRPRGATGLVGLCTLAGNPCFRERHQLPHLQRLWSVQIRGSTQVYLTHCCSDQLYISRAPPLLPFLFLFHKAWCNVATYVGTSYISCAMHRVSYISTASLLPVLRRICRGDLHKLAPIDSEADPLRDACYRAVSWQCL